MDKKSSIDSDRGWLSMALSNLINPYIQRYIERNLMPKLNKLADTLNGLADSVEKIKREFEAVKAELQGVELPTDAQAALNRLTVAISEVDDLNPDAVVETGVAE